MTAAAARSQESLDELTLRRAQRGDESAWRALIERFQPPVHALIWRLLVGRARHRVEDLVQETFVRVLRALPGFDPAGPASLSTWILTIATRLALNELRRPQPAALERFRVAGERNILPDDDTKAAIARAGKTRLIGSYKLCVDTSGTVTTINRLKSTGFDAYDRSIEQKMLDWRYQPFLIDGKPTAVCTAITFIYQQDPEAKDDRSSTAKHDATPQTGATR